MRAWFHRYERALLLLAYFAALGLIAGLWAAHGWQWGLIYLLGFVLVLLACCLVIEVRDQ
jgi:hypothetical protein